ncbi:autotransporter outer membrane beta-barrel domain-containing protein, partial [Escherichia coli]
LTGNEVSLGNKLADDSEQSHYAAWSTTNGKITINNSRLNSFGKIYSSDGSIDINTADNSYLSGWAEVKGTGTLDIGLNGQNSVWDMQQSSVVSNLTMNKSRLNFTNNRTDFKTLTVNGNYNGNDSILNLRTSLGDDSSGTDKLIINGTATGTTNLLVTNMGGPGALTNQGIEVVRIADPNSTGIFQKQKDTRIVAGMYEYDVVKKGSNWYLTSEILNKPVDPSNPPDKPVDPSNPPDKPVDPSNPPDKPVDPSNPDKPVDPSNPDKPVDPSNPDKPVDPSNPDKPVDPSNPDKPVDPNNPAKPNNPNDTNGGISQSGTHYYRPESGSYFSNYAAANQMFVTRLHDRLGETQYIDALTGEKKVTSMWLRNIGGHQRSYDASGQLHTLENRHVMQIGGDIAQWSSNGLDRWHLGLMGGYGKNSSNTRSNKNGYRSVGEVEGYSVGLYGTWYANDKEKNGLHFDSWMLYNWFDNTVKGEKLSSETYKSKGFTASVEAGYSYKMGESGRDTYWIQPKAQVIWMGVTPDNHTEANGTIVKPGAKNNVQTRLGTRAYINGHNAIDDSTRRKLQPFVEANWIHNSNLFGVEMNGLKNTLSGTKNIGEIKAGVEGKISDNFNLWGNVSQSIGGNGYSNTQAQLGIKYSF